MPALAIILYSGLEQRHRSIEDTQQDVLVLTHAMAEAQQEFTRSVRQMLATLSLLPEIQRVDRQMCSKLFSSILEQNSNYLNIALTDLNGEVLASGKPLTVKNFRDRKHVRGVLERKEFSIGEYIISRIGSAAPAFAFAYPVLDKENRLKAVLTTATRLAHISDFHDISNLPEKSFVAITDHKGIRLFYYPPKKDTNPIGKPIKKQSWEKASKASEPEIFIGHGSDGVRRIFAFEQVRFKPDDTPYIYVWAGTPEAYVLAHANAVLTRNLLFLIIATVLSFFISWLIGKNTLLSPIKNLLNLTRRYARGDLEARSKPIARNDEFDALTNAFHDMAEALAKNQRTLMESEERFKLLFEFAPDAYYLLDFEGNFIDGNKKAEHLIGYQKQELIGMNFLKLDLLSEKELLKAAELLAENLDGKPTRPDEYTLKRKDGSQVTVEISTIPIDIGGQGVVLGIARDITERKQSEKALRESEEKLARSKKMESLGLLAGGVAHDLNNVLSGIVSYPELLLMDLPEDSKLRKPVQAIQDSGYRAAAIVQDLLTVARGVAITREPLNLNKMIDEYLESPEFNKLKQLYPAATIKTDLDTGLFNISGSRVHIGKVVMNLVSNAAEAIKGSGIITISTVNRYLDRQLRGYDDVKSGEYVVLSVADDGPGVQPADLDRIFEPFYTKKIMGRSGTGLGLAVVWNILLDHNGYVDVITDENGSAFELYFPMTREDVSSKDLSIPIQDYKGNGETILVVDDVESQRDISCRMLDILGYQTKAVSSGEEAVEYLKQNSADLILLDMIMDPGMNGRETYERIIEIHPGQKAIIVSGFAITEDVKAVQKLGAGKYIKKPYSIEKIGLVVKEALGN
jgi:PAS domain S-box-containing protein